MTIETILSKKGREVVTVTGSQTVLEAVHILVENNIGGLVVVDGARPVGILTERDVLRLTDESAGALGQILVRDAMTTDLVTATPKDDLRHMMDVMTENRIRHLPVLEGETLVGIVSIGDLVNALRVSVESENIHLRQYIQGAG
jgi:CBS domain-containing protein